MDPAKRKQLEERMIRCVGTRHTKHSYDKVSCPKMPQMAEFIKDEFPDLKVEVRGTETMKDSPVGGGSRLRWEGTRWYKGTNLIVRDSAGKLLLHHDSTETYRKNVEVAEWILERKRGKDFVADLFWHDVEALARLEEAGVISKVEEE